MNIRLSLFLLATLLLISVGNAQIVISEIHYHPIEEPAFQADGTPVLELTNDVHEFIEIQNASATAVEISGWALSGGVSYAFPSNTVVAPGAFRVIAKNPALLAAVYSLSVAEVLGPYKGWLGNRSDTVRLRSVDGNTIDSVTYSSNFPWPASADGLGAQDRFTGLNSSNYQYKGRSLQRVSATWPSNDPANWLASPLSGPTPGGPQAVSHSIPKPVVIAKSAVQTADGSPVIRSNQPVTVNCTYSATDLLSAATLEYFVDDINSTGETHTNVVMTDLGNGTYTASIPGLPSRSIVRYRFAADRGDGLEVVSPRADDPQLAPVGIGGAREAWHGYFVTPVRTSTNGAIYDVFVSTAGLSTMSKNVSQTPKRVTAANATGLPRDIPYVADTAPQWNGTVPGVLAWEGQIWDMHIRYHGSLYHRSPSTLSYKLHFPSFQPLHDQTSWFETLHGAEFIEAQKMNRLLGLPASKMRRVDWYFNSSGNNVHSEQGEYDGEMLDAWHASQQQLSPGSPKEETGELYKDVGNRDPSQNSNEGPYTRGDEAPLAANSAWTQWQRYAWTFSLQNNAWKGSKPLRDLLEGMWSARGDSPVTHNFANNPTNLANARAWFTNHWDIDTTLTSMALLEWMSIWDDAAQNHFFWRRANGKWTRLGWDYDNVMGASGGGGPGPGGGGPGGTATQTIYGGEYGATIVFDGVNWWKDTFYKCFRAEYTQRLWELNNSFCDPTNLSAHGFTRAVTFANTRRTYINTQLSSFGTYYKPERPLNVWPTAGATILSATNLVTSDYSHPQSARHAATKWEIRVSTGDYEEPLLRLTSTNDLTSLPLPFDQLTYGQTYYWRASHVDTNGHVSVVSAETSFSWGAIPSAVGVLVLNEILAENHRTVESAGRYPDYIELRNNSSTNIPLAGFTLTDDPLVPDKYSFPADTLIAAGGYLLVWCDTGTSASGLHSGFGLDSAGETVLLLNSGWIVDSVAFGPQAPDVSIGRIVDGTGGWQANTPTPSTANSAKTLGDPVNLKINEWMADPSYGEDWFELYNSDSNVVSLAGLYVSDTPTFPLNTKIPALSFIEGNGFVKFRADGSAAGDDHCNFKLSKSGETLVLTAANATTTIDTITFAAQATDISEGRLPDGSSTIVSFVAKTASPAKPNWVTAPVYINELLANPAPPFEDALELYNAGSNSVDVSGWWLSDDLSYRQKFSIPAGTTIPPGRYRAFYGADFSRGAVPFAFSPHGGEVMLSAVDGSGALTGYGSLVRFGASAENISFGHVESTGLGSASGGSEFWPQVSITFGQTNPGTVAIFRTGTGASNSAPSIGPVIFNEIMFHPPNLVSNQDNTEDEFIELFNTTLATVELAGWRLHGDVEFTFSGASSVPARGYVLVVSFDPANSAVLTHFREKYGFSRDVAIYGPYSPKLANSTFDLELAYPAIVGGNLDYINIDKVQYRDLAPWPTAPDGNGQSMQRMSVANIGNTAANWSAALPSPGAVNRGILSTPTLSVQSYSNALICLLINGGAGATYTLESSINLVDWSPILTTNPPVLPWSWTDFSLTNASSRFYRLSAGP